MAIKIAINGFGRIGRCVTRIASVRDDVEIVAINDTTDIAMMAQLLKYDSVHGPCKDEVAILEDEFLQIGAKRVKVLHFDTPKQSGFAQYGAEVVLECTGLFGSQDILQSYIDLGVPKVILSAIPKDTAIPIYIMGINEQEYQGECIISNASCTTNALAPLVKILDETFGIEKGTLTTLHSYTNEQNLLDAKHPSELRRGRAAAINMVPTLTGSARALTLVMPHLKDKIIGQSVRIPTPNVGILDMSIVLKCDTSTQKVKQTLEQKAKNEFKEIILVDKERRVSQDFVGASYSCIVADDLIEVVGGNVVKMMAWYDNEWGYSTRLLDMAVFTNK